MWRHTETQKVFAFQGITCRQALAQVVLRIACIRGREFDQDNTEGSSHAAVDCGPACLLGKEIHVVEGGDAAFQHFGAGESGAVINEPLGDVPSFGRPDVFGQPVHQCEIIGEPAKQCHRRMRVQIDESWNQYLAVELAR